MERQESFGIVDYDERPVKITKPTVPLPYFFAPLKIFLEITNHCNLNCWFCVNKSGSSRHCQLSLEQIDRIMQEVSRMGVLEVALTGGEPLLHPDFPRIIETIKEYKFPIYLNTNASMDEPIWKTLIEYEKDIKGIMVSFDGPKDKHDEIRGKGSYDKMWENIKKLGNKEKVKLRFTVCDTNKDSIEETIKLADSYGYDIKFAPVILPLNCDMSQTYGYIKKLRDEHNNDRSKKNRVTIESQFRYYDSSTKNPCEYLMNKKMLFYTKCGIRFVHLGINCKGEVFASGRQTDFCPWYKVGDIDKNTLHEIWLRNIIEYTRFYTECGKCGDVDIRSILGDSLAEIIK